MIYVHAGSWYVNAFLIASFFLRYDMLQFSNDSNIVTIGRCVAFDLDGLLWRPSLAQLGYADLALHCSWPNMGGALDVDRVDRVDSFSLIHSVDVLWIFCDLKTAIIDLFASCSVHNPAMIVLILLT